MVWQRVRVCSSARRRMPGPPAPPPAPPGPSADEEDEGSEPSDVGGCQSCALGYLTTVCVHLGLKASCR
eukprot:6254995-Alexandrium_andersonii.AAC.1